MPKQKRLWGRKDWAPIIEEYLASPTPTHSDFTEPRGLNLRTFRRWLTELRDERSSVVHAPQFIEVELPVETRPLVRLIVGTLTVDFETLPPPGWFAQLAALEAERC